MKPHHWYAAAIFVVALLVTTVASAQEHRQFDEHDRQVTRDWYNQHQSNPPRGLRNQDRLSAREEAQLERGQALRWRLRRKGHDAPSDLYRLYPPPPPRHRYVVIGQHVVLIDDHHVVRDIIHLH
jgi:Ni/Co efflux regulator RcnB